VHEHIERVQWVVGAEEWGLRVFQVPVACEEAGGEEAKAKAEECDHDKDDEKGDNEAVQMLLYD